MPFRRLQFFDDRPRVAEATFAFRAAPGPGELPAIAAGGAVIYTPASDIEVEGFDMWASLADPFVAGGGATTVAMHLSNAGGGIFSMLLNQGISNWNANTNGRGHRIGAGGAPVRDGMALAPRAAFADSGASGGHSLRISCDVGTVTGKLYVRLHFRRVVAIFAGLP